MRIGDLTSGATKLRLSTESLAAAWAETNEVWRDNTARQFDENYLQVLIPKVKATLEAMNRLSTVLAKAQQECGPE